MATIVSKVKNLDGTIDVIYSEQSLRKYNEADLIAEKQILLDKIKEIDDILI